jgi:hypothetical protein
VQRRGLPALRGLLDQDERTMGLRAGCPKHRRSRLNQSAAPSPSPAAMGIAAIVPSSHTSRLSKRRGPVVSDRKASLGDLSDS